MRAVRSLRAILSRTCERLVDRPDHRIEGVVHTADNFREFSSMPRDIGPVCQVAVQSGRREAADVFDHRLDAALHGDHGIPEQILLGHLLDVNAQVALGDAVRRTGALALDTDHLTQRLGQSSDFIARVNIDAHVHFSGRHLLCRGRELPDGSCQPVDRKQSDHEGQRRKRGVR